MNHDHSRHDSGPKGFWGSRYSIGLIVLGAIAAYFLLSEHRAHFFGALPFLLLLACPLIHVFMHHGHGGHGGQQRPDTSTPPQPPKTGEQP
ncbi:DUF2933 domain-containing protein [Polaromonas sp.]|uniref:DUF2933 domain-containing protein n=1 Tax=Polaromonas sp. TaxID=1869339 RepID=UPI0018559C11|nr:DUF2933 domain-containing protein [Polaromonas sp.]NMM06327.1 DUF2933 domain-containing protein [Polaromonas sp.]